MGGEVFVGVRDREKNFHFMLRWTNSMPYWMLDPEFWLNSEKLEEFCAEAKPTNDWPQSKLVDAVSSSEYGVILFDFPNKQVLSRQGYCSPGDKSFVVGLSSDGDGDVALSISKLQRLGWIKDIQAFGEREYAVLEGVALKEFLAACEKVGKEFETNPDSDSSLFPLEGMFRILYQPEGWTIDHRNDPARFVWSDVTAWLTKNEWNVKVETSEPEAAD
jgi:hypothetical protein